MVQRKKVACQQCSRRVYTWREENPSSVTFESSDAQTQRAPKIPERTDMAAGESNNRPSMLLESS